MDFDTLEFKAQGNAFFLDEIRFAASWRDALPLTGIYALNSSAGEHGEIVIQPASDFYTQGNEVTLTAEGDFGYRFNHWEGDVPANMTENNPLTLVMDRDRTVSAAFVQGKPDFFSFDPGPDPYSDSAIDLRFLNEPIAGQNGFVSRSGDQFLLGNGQPVRFWAVNAIPDSATDVDELARFLAKRGVNMVRWHTSIYDNGAPALHNVRNDKIDQLHRLVTAMKKEGVYTKISFFFILGLRIKPEWDIDGYNAAWLSAHPEEASSAPFGLQFFDEDFKYAYKQWARQLLTRPNPYEDDKAPLRDDPAVAIIECQNEDNLFFWTFNPDRYPPEAQHKLESLFAAFLIEKYGGLENAIQTWGSGNGWTGDAPADGRMGLRGAWYMTGQYQGSSYDRLRIADQIEFLGRLQHDWYQEMIGYMRDDLGCRCLFSASNWTTADNRFLLDLEHYSYTAADVIDTHSYFSPFISEKGVFTAVSGGDRFYGIPAVNNPRRLPAAFKQIEGHPSILSEFTWTQPSLYKAEGPLMMAAYGAMTDIDGLFWFALSDPGWQEGNGTWNIASPSILGQFPGAALLYRRGDVAAAPVVVREGRSLESIYHKETALVVESQNEDPTRNLEPSDTPGELDNLAFLTGKVELGFDRDEDMVSPLLSELIDYDQRRVKSITSELDLFWGTAPGLNPPDSEPATGWFKVNTPRSQGASGWLAEAGPLALENVTLDMENRFGNVLVTSLDGLPLALSSRVLIQAGTRDWPRAFKTNPVTLTRDGKQYAGAAIVDSGTLPWQIEGIRAAVELKGMGEIERVEALDGNGYPLAELEPVQLDEGAVRIDLPAQAMYTLVILKPQDDGYRLWTWQQFPPEQWMDTERTGPDRNPDQDAFDNRGEYLFGLDPLTPDSGDILEPSVNTVHEQGSTLHYPEVTFDIREAVEGLDWRIETSEDLESWHYNGDGTGGSYTEIAAIEPLADGMSRITAHCRLPLHPDRARFIRILAEELNP
jgi:hypothetical protein